MRYDPYDRSIVENPYPTYQWLRDEAPVYQNEEIGFWALSRWDDVLGARLTRSVLWEEMLDWEQLVLASPSDAPVAETAVAGSPRKGSPA